MTTKNLKDMTYAELARLYRQHPAPEPVHLTDGREVKHERLRRFNSGATRSPLGDKLQYEGYLSPLVLKRFAQYMKHHQMQADGTQREPDNWQKAIPLPSYMDSGWRHFMDWWQHHRGNTAWADEPLEEALCGLLFNVMGYLHETLQNSEK